MIRFIVALSAVLALSACKEDGPTVSNEASPGGLEYTLVHMSGHQDVTIRVAWPTDWTYREGVNETAPIVGTQLILAGGAEGYPAGVAGERFADLNSEGHLVSTTDHAMGVLIFEKIHMDETIEIANAHIRAPVFDEVWFNRIRDGISRNMAEARSHPAHRGYDAVRWAVLGNHPLRRSLSLDEPRAFENLVRDDVVHWHAETITRSPDSIVIAGEVSAEQAGAAIDALFEDLPGKSREINRHVVPDFAPRRILLHIPDSETASLAFIAPLPPTRLGHEEEDILVVSALGGDEESVLFEAVRTGLRASYSFSAGIDNFSREHRLLFMAGAVETSKLTAAEKTVSEAYTAFLEEGLPGDLDALKAPILSIIEENQSFVDTLSAAVIQSNLDGHDPREALEFDERMGSVTSETVRERLDASYPSADDFIVIAVSSDADALPGACVISHPIDAADCL